MNEDKKWKYVRALTRKLFLKHNNKKRKKDINILKGHINLHFMNIQYEI